MEQKIQKAERKKLRICEAETFLLKDSSIQAVVIFYLPALRNQRQKY